MVKLNNDNFESTIADGVVLVKFGAIWCGPCRMIDRVLDKIADNYKSEPNIKICSVDIDESQDIAKHYNISSVPTMMFIKDGEPSNTKFVGIKAERDIVNMIESMK